MDTFGVRHPGLILFPGFSELAGAGRLFDSILNFHVSHLLSPWAGLPGAVVWLRPLDRTLT
jgi:hypothetical protein